MNVNANTKFYDKMVDRSAMVRLYERRVSKDVHKELADHEERLDEIVRGSTLNGRLKPNFMDRVDIEISDSYRNGYNTINKSLIDLFVDQASYAYQNIESIFGKLFKPEMPPLRIAEEVVLKRPFYNDQTLLQGWAGIGSRERMRIEQTMRRGIAESKSINEIALMVRKGNVHNISRSQSKGLVVTAVTSITNQADAATYEANSKYIKGYQYVAVLDSRTTPICASRDGKIFPINDNVHRPPAHFYCRSTTVPVFKSWEDVIEVDALSEIRRRNLEKLTDKQKAFYDGQTPLREPYHDWLFRQSKEVQLKHLGDYKKVELFNSGQIHLDRFDNDVNNDISLKQLRELSTDSYTISSDTRRFASAKAKLDSMRLWATKPEDFIDNKELSNTLKDFYILQAGELDGTLSITNYRGMLLHTKKSMRRRVLTNPPREDQIIFNPVSGRYEDVRIYQPQPAVLDNSLRLINESVELKQEDKKYLVSFVNSLQDTMSINERAVVADNLRILFTRYRKNPEQWGNFKAVSQAQIKFDVMNISDSIETQLRRNSNVLKRMFDSGYYDPVLGFTDLQKLHDNLFDNIDQKNYWEDFVAPKIAKKLRSAFDNVIARGNVNVWSRLSERDLNQFYLKFANRISIAETPDRDALAVQLGRDLYNLANFNGSRREWYELGLKIIESDKVKGIFELETFGVQKRRMKSKMSGAYFGPYYDTLSYNIRVTDPDIQAHIRKVREVELGLRVAVVSPDNRLVFKKGYKTYFMKRNGLLSDTRIPVTSTSSFSDFPEEFMDDSIVDALNWAGKSEYKIDKDYYNFITKLLQFEDDKGKAKYYNELNEYRKYISSRGDSYERFKAMEWLAGKDYSFSNTPFIDHRARIYDRGMISPQSGETFRPFLNTKVERNFSEKDFLNFKDQIGAFLGGLSDNLEGRYNSLTITGRQKIADKWWKDMVVVGNHMRRAKPNDIRAVLESGITRDIDGEDIGKFYRFAIEVAKLDEFLLGKYDKRSLGRLNEYKTSLALEQDASSSGAQIIALTTRNKQLAEMSNVLPTNYKKRLYDEIAALTFNDPRFKEINKKLGLSEKDLRKAAKAQNMVTFYGAGERTGIMNVEGKLKKVLGKDSDTLVVSAADRDQVLNEISAQIARYERFDPDTADELRVLRSNVKDIFNKGMDPGDEIMEQLWFLQPQTKELVEKMSVSYQRVVTPDDFKYIAKIMSEYLAVQVPILKDFTRYFGRLAQDYLTYAKPSNADFDWKSVSKIAVEGTKEKGYILPDWVNKLFNLRKEPLSEKALRNFGFWEPDGNLAEFLYGVEAPKTRKTGAKFFKLNVVLPEVPTPSNLLKKQLLTEVDITEVELFYANKLPKSWTNVPWVNFDGKIIEQNFTQAFEERIAYKTKDGQWINNIVMVDQKTSPNWWEELANKSGKINDIANATKARTAFAVNGNHSNDAVIVKKFHLWGKENGIPTSTIHDAFFANTADMLKARTALREIYAKTLDNNSILMTLNEMRARGLPQDLYDKYLNEAIDIGLIPVPGRSVIGGKVIKESDILTKEDILQQIEDDFKKDRGWYGVG
jgi:SPP1 gp7 family putative phage head morphogenesis protein